MEEKKLSMKDYVMETPEYVLRNIGNSTGLTAPLLAEYVQETKHTDRHPLNEPFRDLIRTKA